MKKVFFFFFILCIYFFANYYVFYHVWEIFKGQPYGLQIIFWIVSIFLSFSPVIFYTGYKKLPVNISSFLYKLGTGWLIILLYPFILFLIVDGLNFLNSSFQIFPDRLFKGSGIAFVFLFVVFLCLYGYRNYQNKKRITLTLSTKKSLGKSIKMVVVTDLHLGYAIGSSELQQWVQKINKEKPDIVLIAGDIIDNSIIPLEYYKLYDCFKEIKAPLGIYTCLGNHEYLSGVEESIKFIEKAGIHLVRDSSVLVDQSFYIVGRDDKTNLQRKDLSELIETLDKTKPIIVLDHQPYHLEEAEQNVIDLQLSGHTHRGQVWPFSLVTDLLFEKSHGYIKKGNTHIYVSSGLGIWGGRLRIGTQSEFVVIKLQSEGK